MTEDSICGKRNAQSAARARQLMQRWRMRRRGCGRGGRGAEQVVCNFRLLEP